MMRILAITGLALVCSTQCGCQPTTQPAAPAAPANPTPVAAQNPAQSSPEIPAQAAANPETAPVFQPKKALPGVAKQGRSLDNEKGVGAMIAQPVKTLFAFRERAVFTIEIPHALQLFEATEGRKTKSHQEFMDKVIKANQIQLPELPAGQEYKFHTDTGELWVHPIEPKPESKPQP